MSKLFSRLFGAPPSTPDGLSQQQREAIIDLLNFCMCADDRLRRVEDRVIQQESARHAWEGATPVETFAEQSLARAYGAVHRYENRSAFIADIAQRLGSSAHRARALALAQRLFWADQEFPDAEQVVWREIRAIFA